MSPSAETADPEAGGVEVDLNDSRDTMGNEITEENTVPEPDDWSESQGEDEVRSDSLLCCIL